MYVDEHAAASKYVFYSNFVSLQELDENGLYNICMRGDWFPRPYCEQRCADFIDTQMAVSQGGTAWVKAFVQSLLVNCKFLSFWVLSINLCV